MADLLHQDESSCSTYSVEEVDYDLPAITTGGRWWVAGQAATPCSKAPFRFFVKQVQSWSRSPFFQYVPEDLQEWAASTVPWKTEAGSTAPTSGACCLGTAGPRALAVFDLDAMSSAIWLQAVTGPPGHVGPLGGISARPTSSAASPAAARSPPSGACGTGLALNTYATGRPRGAGRADPDERGGLAAPAVRRVRPGVRERCAHRGRTARRWLAEADALPYLLSHGDACPNNLMAGGQGDDFVMIDFGFWGGAPAGST